MNDSQERLTIETLRDKIYEIHHNHYYDIAGKFVGTGLSIGKSNTNVFPWDLGVEGNHILFKTGREVLAYLNGFETALFKHKETTNDQN